MMLNDEERGKVAALLAGDLPLFDKIDAAFVTAEADRNRLEGEVESLKGALEDADKNRVQLLEQVSNLYSRLPGGQNMTKPTSVDEQIKNLFKEDW